MLKPLKIKQTMREDDTKHQTDDTLFKPKYGRNEARDTQRSRIFDTIVAHCYAHAEFQTAWYNYLNEYLLFPFQADIAVKVNHSGEVATKTIDIMALADEASCLDDIFVKAETGGEYAYFFVSILDLQNIQGSESTRQSIADWQFWCSDYF